MKVRLVDLNYSETLIQDETAWISVKLAKPQYITQIESESAFDENQAHFIGKFTKIDFLNAKSNQVQCLQKFQFKFIS